MFTPFSLFLNKRKCFNTFCVFTETPEQIPVVSEEEKKDINYVCYLSELQMPDIMKLIQKDLSEPYSIYTYRYFIHNWPKLCFLVRRIFPR